jgi:hypothetical protein
MTKPKLQSSFGFLFRTILTRPYGFLLIVMRILIFEFKKVEKQTNFLSHFTVICLFSPYTNVVIAFMINIHKDENIQSIFPYLFMIGYEYYFTYNRGGQLNCELITLMQDQQLFHYQC